MNNQNNTITKLAETALLAALCYVAFTFLQIKIPVPGGDATSIHIGNAFCVLGALLLGGWYGGLAGGHWHDGCGSYGSCVYHRRSEDLYLKALYWSYYRTCGS